MMNSKEIVEDLQREIEYWKNQRETDETSIAVATGAIGALSNVLFRARGGKTEPREGEE